MTFRRLSSSFIVASLAVLTGCATSNGLNLQTCQTINSRKTFDIGNTTVPVGGETTMTVNIDQPFSYTYISHVNEACEEAKMTASLAMAGSTWKDGLNPRFASAAQIAISKYAELSKSPDIKVAEFNSQVLEFLPQFLKLGGFDLEKVSVAANQYKSEQDAKNAAAAAPASLPAGSPTSSSCRTQGGPFLACK